MNTKDFLRLGVPLRQATRRATDFISKFILVGGDKSRLHEEVAAIVANPSAFVDDPLRGEFAKALLNAPPPPRTEPVKYRQWGEGLEHEAVRQMEKACLLPVSVAGALMPDAHVGYGLPIGGVLATDNAVIPYAVGVDIACRMKMTVLDIPLRDLENKQDRLTRAIETETRFGVGANFRDRRAHDVLDADWSVSPITKQNKDKAWSQLGTSGSGNHFVEFGILTVHSSIPWIDEGRARHSVCADGGQRTARPTNELPAGQYVALLSHSGSRGTGASVCDYYSKIAFSQFPDFPSELKRLAWLSLDSQEGQEYWNAMELMGKYAAANHACIHKHIAENLGATVLLDLENHHNFAWKEKHVIGGVEREVIQGNFPEDKQTGETAMLFLQLIMRKLRRQTGKARAAVVVPNGTLFGDGVCARIKEELLKEFNLHTIVRLPNGVFAPYTGIPTNILFFDRSGPTREVWYYEQPLPEGRKNYTKTAPIQFEEFAPLVAWWNKRVENDHAWKIPAAELLANGCNLDRKNPSAKEDITHLPPAQLAADILKKEQRIAEIMGNIQKLLAKPAS